MYEHDFRLSQFSAATSDLSETYARFGSDLQLDQRPADKVFFNCIDSIWTGQALTDKFVTEVCQRWEVHRIFRDLYLNQAVSKEYDMFRAIFTKSVIFPRLPAPGLPMLRTVLRSGKHSRHFGPEFSGRFHKALCIHSIAIESRKLAVATNFTSANSEDTIASKVFEIWNKDVVIDASGNTIMLHLQDKLDCIEVFDFLYLFVLKKLLPLNNVMSWVDANSSEWIFSEICYGDEEIWETLLGYSRWALAPKDLAELLAWGYDKSQLNYPIDKHSYLVLRGTFDMGIPSNLDWFSYTERWSMVRGLLENNFDGDVFEASNPCWWDRFRETTGSPFDPNFLEEALLTIRAKHVNSDQGGQSDDNDDSDSDDDDSSDTIGDDDLYLEILETGIVDALR